MSAATRVGSYVLRGVIAEGAVATVYEAAHLILPRRVALKILRAELVGSVQAAQRVLRQGCVLEAIVHPGVVRAFDCGVIADGRSWIAMELVDGESLSAMIERMGRLPVAAVVDLTAGLLDVVAAAHRAGIAHCDLEPAHVLVAGSGPGGVRVLGWGLARQQDRSAVAPAATGDGSPAASAARDDLIADCRRDIYAVGAIAYQAATGHPPAVAPALAGPRVSPGDHRTPVRALRLGLSLRFAAIIESMLASDPAARPTAAELVDQLARLGGEPYHELVVVGDPAAPGPRPVPPPAPSSSVVDRDWELLIAS